LRIRRIVIAAQPAKATPLPDTGVPTTWDPHPECTPDTLVITGPRGPRPQGPCRVITVPHLPLLPYLARQAARHGWHAIAGDPDRYIHKAAMEALEEARRYQPPWQARLAPPSSPPPIHVWADIYHQGDPQETLERALQALSQGADAIVLGGLPGGDPHTYKQALRLVAREAPVLADPAGLATPEEAYTAGTDGYMSLTPETLHGVPEHLRPHMVYVLIPGSLATPQERAQTLLQAEDQAYRLGYKRLVLDPVLQPPIAPGALTGLIAALHLRPHTRAPIMLGANNAYELTDADTTGTIAILAALAAEAGASILLASQHSHKAQGAILEARLAADLASLALHLGTPPKDYPIRLLLSKAKRPAV